MLSSRVSLVMSHTPESYPSGSALCSLDYIDIEASTFEKVAISLPFERHMLSGKYECWLESMLKV